MELFYLCICNFSTTLMLLRSSWLKYTLSVLLLTVVAGISCAQVTVNGSSANLIYDGIDVSSYQKDIDWSATAKDKNIKFVYVKATEGATYRSRHYQYNIENARQYGIHVGAYHFFRPNVPVEKQFRNFTSVVKKEDQDLIPLIDVEVRGNNLTVKALVDSVLAFADKLEDHYGCKPMIYTGHAFYNSYLSGKISGYPLFIARYSKVEPRLMGGANWVLWQFSEKGVIAGIDHAVDLCRFNKGCGLKDILISGRKVRSRTHTTAQKERRPELAAEEKKEVKPNPEQEKLDKEARKRAEKRKAEEKKEAERLAKQKEKLRKLKEKEQKEAAKQEQKRREKAAKEARKRAEKEEKMRQEQAKRDQKEREEFLKKKDKERQEAKERQEEQVKADRQRKQKQEEQARKREEVKRAQEKAAKKQSQNQKAKNQGRRVNQSSPDNDDIYY